MNFDSLLERLHERRLIFHAGTTKTGSTSLQQYLFSHRDALKQQGILYPSSIASQRQPKHQWLIESLVRQNQHALNAACEHLETELNDQIHTVFLSTEGLYNHFFDYIDANREALKKLCSCIDFQIVTVFRDPLEFSLASFKQGLINPANSWSPYYGHTRSLEELCSDENWLQRLNYDSFVQAWRELAGEENVHCIPYSRKVLQTLCSNILDFSFPTELQPPLANTSVGSLGVQLLHVLNRHRLPEAQRTLAIEHIRSIDHLAKTKFEHSMASQACIERHCTTRLLRLCATTPQLSLTVRDYLHTLATPAISTKQQANHQDDPSDLAFLLCLEAGFIEEQTILLVQSVRLFGGRYAGCPIYLICPRPHRQPSKATIQTLALMDAIVIVEDLNQSLDHFPYANKAYALAHLERYVEQELIVFLDSDTLMLGEPRSLAISDSHDFAARPVDVRGICSSPLDSVYKSYWTDLCSLAGLSIDALPITLTGVTREAIHANYNGGLLVVRRRIGFGSRWQDLLEKAWEKGLSPRPGNFWGSGQSTFAVAAHALTTRAHLLPDGYNIPLHSPAPGRDLLPPEHPRHVHYHWLLESEHFHQGLDQLLRLSLSDHCRTFLQALKPFQHRRGESHTGFPANSGTTG